MQMNQSINDCEERIKDLLKIYDNRLEDMRIENSKLVMDLKSQYNSLMQEWKIVLGIKQEIFKRFDNEVERIVEGNKDLLNRFDGYKKEFKLIKNILQYSSSILAVLFFYRSILGFMPFFLMTKGDILRCFLKMREKTV
jgi:hypothetical protein